MLRIYFVHLFIRYVHAIFVEGMEFSGKIVEIGPNVSSLKPGDHVICITRLMNGGFGQEAVTADSV